MSVAEAHGEVHHMKITDSGQVSVPAAVRRRWSTHHVRITDAGDHLVVEPEAENPFESVRGVLRGLTVTGDEMRRRDRAEESAIESRKRRK
jgi:bifunctional DNA-binding transcriptional regulator/antitoxin component of YhaV-PrlF toxin-antitoxin module